MALKKRPALVTKKLESGGKVYLFKRAPLKPVARRKSNAIGNETISASSSQTPPSAKVKDDTVLKERPAVEKTKRRKLLPRP